MTGADGLSETEDKALNKRVLTFILRAGLFWNNQPYVESWVGEDGIFYHHGSLSAGEHFFQFLRSIGVLFDEGRRHRFVIRSDAISHYADFLIDSGFEIERAVDALVAVGGETWLCTSRESFQAKYYDEPEGSGPFDLRPLMRDLARLGYAHESNGQYRWSPTMEPILKAHHL
ncbi:hypothetical protein [Sphingomonas lenta]|uniref:Uncharacterized protein n=1 Tax=Sphingomonas lenta TaxID=1141887 RepID=A0A2A2SAG3_9SPHN|nr:hypothetical protein [Sphingomonas lenta]PAX06294.1 hypothetical protein CKY28_17975 [Sphingomonas lenta]